MPNLDDQSEDLGRGMTRSAGTVGLVVHALLRGRTWVGIAPNEGLKASTTQQMEESILERHVFEFSGIR